MIDRLRRLLSRTSPRGADATDDATGSEPAPDAQPGRALQQLLLQVLQRERHAASLHDEVVVLDNGLQLLTELVDLAELRSGVRTASCIRVHHASLFPDGIVEFQHSIGEDTEASLASGFTTWARTDLVALSEAVAAPSEARCMTLQMEFPATAEAAVRRTVVLGPVAHMNGDAARAAAGEDTEHAFCPCCLFTNSLDALMPLLQRDQRMLGIRLFASRDADGEVAADCRVNGEDFPDGVACLRRYAETWPALGALEFRKQYAVVRLPEPVAPDAAH
ncbi:hypothetical protein J7373_14910 [Xanthomonas sp. A2111]|uniref:DUF6348 family protein n=1 Tax=Xanthomonas hawaiiensis TaxID=3003247 RepID=A0ABU2I788_9XANT|nr:MULTISPECIES: DUF6348 family protein [unclassified Xanthomonas]MBO9829540.1 hypothetical protein [Xanthomonas sp. A2111]MBO9875360.1 hypothetical protein [Xanthomonas sp. D-93]MDS9993695.1 DUF6348 family protein [Xanthomonas sp. A2111]WNH45435.1 DUF6348 family protein [Xanthomonas sp. A6251]